MFSCAKCRGGELVRVKRGTGVSWDCPQCRGRLFGVGVLRKLFPKPVINTIWQAAVASPNPGSARCPSCSHPMQTFTAPVDGKPLALDVCKRCYLIWFDDQELETLPTTPQAEKSLSPEAKQAVAMVDVQWQGERAKTGEPWSNDYWKALIKWLKMPASSP